jgi:hypothetical protein
LAINLQTKYNKGIFEKGTLLSMHADVELYRSLFCLHQIYLQLSLLKRKVALKMDHGEGHLKVLFYPAFTSERLLFSVTLLSSPGSRFEAACSWNSSLKLEPSFSCFTLGELVSLDAYRHVCSISLGSVMDELGQHCAMSDYNVLQFVFLDYRAKVSINRQSGQYEVTFAGDAKRVLIENGRKVCQYLKRMASEHFVSLIRSPDITRAFPSTEQSRIGSFPKVFIGLQHKISLGVSFAGGQHRALLF